MRDRRPMDPVDQLLLRQESDLRRRSTITLVVHLDRMPEYDVFVSRLVSAVRCEPQLRQRVVRPWRNLGAPEWVVQRHVDVHEHLTQGTVAAPGTMRELVEFVESIPQDDLDPDRPLWHLTLLDGMADDGAALVARMSHVLTDGLNGMHLLAGLVDVGGQPVASAPSESLVAVPGETSEALSSARLTVERILAAPARAQLRYWRNYGIGIKATAAVLDHPRLGLQQATRYSRSLLRVATPKTAPPSFPERSARRRLIEIDLPEEDLRLVGRDSGGSLNDAYLAGITGGLRRYQESMGITPCEVPFAIPVSTRKRDGGGLAEADAGNRFAGVRFTAPVSEVDPSTRIRKLSALVRAAKNEPALDAMTTLAPALVQLPDRLLGLAGRAQDRLDMQASYVPGPPVHVGLAGAVVTSMLAFGPLPGPAAMSVLLTYAGVARIGFTVDAVAIPDVDGFRQAMVEGFAEVLALGHVASADGR